MNTLAENSGKVLAQIVVAYEKRTDTRSRVNNHDLQLSTDDQIIVDFLTNLPIKMLLQLFVQVQICKGGDPQKLVMRAEDYLIFLPLGLSSVECIIEEDVTLRTLDFLQRYGESVRYLNVVQAPGFRDDDEKSEASTKLNNRLKEFLKSLKSLNSIYIRRQLWALDTLVEVGDDGKITCPNLTTFTLSTSITNSDKDTSTYLKELLLSRPKLKKLTYCGFESFFDISSIGPLLGLKEINGTMIGCDRQLSDFVKTFPNLCKISVYLTKWYGSLKELGKLTSLDHLTVIHDNYDIDFYPVMGEYLVLYGYRLTDLNVNYFHSVSVQFLANFCPNLRSLNLSCDVIEMDVNSSASWIEPSRGEIVRHQSKSVGKFSKLIDLTLSCSIKYSHPVKFLMTEAKNLKELKISLADYEKEDRRRFVDAAYRGLDFILDNTPPKLQRLEIWEPKPLAFQFFKLLPLHAKVKIIKIRGCPVRI